MSGRKTPPPAVVVLAEGVERWPSLSAAAKQRLLVAVATSKRSEKQSAVRLLELATCDCGRFPCQYVCVGAPGSSWLWYFARGCAWPPRLAAGVSALPTATGSGPGAGAGKLVLGAVGNSGVGTAVPQTDGAVSK